MNVVYYNGDKMTYYGKQGTQYTVVHNLAQISGGMANILFVRTLHGDVHALKVCMSPQQTFISRFRQEIRIHKVLQGITTKYDGVVGFIDEIVPQNGLPGFVMTYIQYGQDISDWVQTRLSTIRTANEKRTFLYEVFLRLFELLETMHSKGVLHNDLKPANIMVTGTGLTGNGYKIYFLDFGLARKFTDIIESSCLGTIGYAPKELLTEPNNADTSSDVFTIVVICLELLLGKPILHDFMQTIEHLPDEEYNQVLLQHWMENMDNILVQVVEQCKQNADIPDKLATLFLQALKPLKQRAYRTSAEFLLSFRFSLHLLHQMPIDIERFNEPGQVVYLGWVKYIGSEFYTPWQGSLVNPPQFQSHVTGISSTLPTRMPANIYWCGNERDQSSVTFAFTEKIPWKKGKRGMFADIHPLNQSLYPAVRVFFPSVAQKISIHFHLMFQGQEGYIVARDIRPIEQSAAIKVYTYKEPNIWQEIVFLQTNKCTPYNVSFTNPVVICWDQYQDKIVNIFQYSHHQNQMVSVFTDPNIQAGMHFFTQGIVSRFQQMIVPPNYPFTTKTEKHIRTFFDTIDNDYPLLRNAVFSTYGHKERHMWFFSHWGVYSLLVYWYHHSLFQGLSDLDWVSIFHNCVYHTIGPDKANLIWYFLPTKPSIYQLHATSTAQDFSGVSKHQISLWDPQQRIATNWNKYISSIHNPFVCFTYTIDSITTLVILYDSDVLEVGRWNVKDKIHVPLFLSPMVPTKFLRVEYQNNTIVTQVDPTYASLVYDHSAFQKISIVDKGCHFVCTRPECRILLSTFFSSCPRCGTPVQDQSKKHMHHLSVQAHNMEGLGASIVIQQKYGKEDIADTVDQYIVATKWFMIENNIRVFITPNKKVFVRLLSSDIKCERGGSTIKMNVDTTVEWKNEKFMYANCTIEKLSSM